MSEPTRNHGQGRIYVDIPRVPPADHAEYVWKEDGSSFCSRSKPGQQEPTIQGSEKVTWSAEQARRARDDADNNPHMGKAERMFKTMLRGMAEEQGIPYTGGTAIQLRERNGEVSFIKPMLPGIISQYQWGNIATSLSVPHDKEKKQAV
ncbi:hypothetical protein FGRMN_9336, partial [Fusarium graminum]